MEDKKNVDEIINSIKKRDKSTPSASIYWYVLGVVSVIALSILSYKYINSKFNGIEEKYNMMSSEITKEIKELKDINENRINEMDKVLSEADSGLKKEIKLLWTSAYKKNRDSMRKLENEFVERKTDQDQRINSIDEQIAELVNKEKRTIKKIESIQSGTKKIESNIKENLSEIKKMELSINKSLDETRAYSDNRIDTSVGMIEEKLRAYTLEILNIKDELNQQKDEMMKIKDSNTKLLKENTELRTELQRIKDGSLVLDPDKAVSTNGEQ